METERIYKSRLDYYYKSLVVYLMFFIVYALIRGSFFEAEFRVVFADPIIYISIIFILFFLVVLISNTIKAKELIVNENKLILKNRFMSREIDKSDIISLRYSRERKRNKDSKSEIKVVKIKLKNRKRYIRFRISEFYDEKKLLQEFKNISKGLIHKI